MLQSWFPRSVADLVISHLQCCSLFLLPGADAEEETLVEDEDVTAEKQRAQQASGTSQVGNAMGWL